MADLDAELLALAGGDSSGDESVVSAPRKKSSSPPRPVKAARGSPDPDTSRKGVAKTVRRTKKRKTYSDDEDEESEASERSASAAMSQSDSEAEFEPAEDKPIFPYDKLYYDADDKARIQSKPEIEREEILAQRSEQVERHEQDLTLRRLVAQRAREEARAAAKNKRKASAADLDDNQRKSTRQRTKLGGGKVGEVDSAMEAYRKQRAEKSLREEQRKKNPTLRRPSSPQDDYSDGDAEGESDNDFDDRRPRRRSPSPPKDEPIADLVDVQRARIGRDNFAQVCYTPGFEKAVTNCYARVCLGPGRQPGINEYRVCLIKGLTTGKPYAMTGSNGRAFPVDQYIQAAHGKSTKPWSFLECSMSKFTDDEWRRYRLTMANEDCKMPTKKAVANKLQELEKLITYRFSEADITDKINKQKQLTDTVFRIQEKDELREKITRAREAGDDDLVTDLEEQLANVIPQKLAFGTSLARTESGYVNKEQEKLAELNRRNQRLNAENVRKAQLLEMRARKAKKHLAPGVDELFEGGSDVSRAGTPVPNGGTPKLGAQISRAGTPNPMSLADRSTNGTPRGGTPVPMAAGLLKLTEKKKTGIPVIRKSALDDEILASMDLGIEIDL